ncbi:MAG: hypothetical protein AAF902_25050, partial [Chloroflexota bacterium]
VPVAPEEDEENADEEDSEEEPVPDTAEGIETIFVYVDDDGAFLGESESDTVDITALISDQYDVTTWQVSEKDEALELDDLEGFDLIIWYSAEYREEEFDFEDEANLIFEALFDGGNLLIMGATPPTLEPAELVDLSTVRYAEHPILDGLGLTLDEPVSLDQAISASVLELIEDDLGEGEAIFMFRADDNEFVDNAVGATVYNEFTDTRFVLLTIPLQVFGEDIQTQFIDNLIVWFGSASSE